MFLTVSKRLEFSASRRLFVREWSDARNLAAFGSETSARYGSGRNYVAYFVFSGAVDPVNGMLMNISEIKERTGKILHAGFDHKFLNEDNGAFRNRPPTAENIACQLFLEAAPRFADSAAKLVACHLCESEEHSATFYASHACEANYWFEFSAARQTMSPVLTQQENDRLFGSAASPFGHGHHYRARLTFRDESFQDPIGPLVNHAEIDRCMQSLRGELDHKNLNHEVPALADRALTTESLAQFVHERVASVLPVARVRLHERDDFFAEYSATPKWSLGMRMTLDAAHRLHSAALSDKENVDLYGKCSNSLGHGHRYLVEATLTGNYDASSGVLYDFERFRTGMADALAPWQDKHLNLEIEAFRDMPSTGENIVHALWPRMETALGSGLSRLRLWETANNRFTLRRQAPDA
ncbi:MAG: 6-carboxytetrahydropterin synthase [Chthoniobacterales bacterium]